MCLDGAAVDVDLLRRARIPAADAGSGRPRSGLESTCARHVSRIDVDGSERAVLGTATDAGRPGAALRIDLAAKDVDALEAGAARATAAEACSPRPARQIQFAAMADDCTRPHAVIAADAGAPLGHTGNVQLAVIALLTIYVERRAVWYRYATEGVQTVPVAKDQVRRALHLHAALDGKVLLVDVIPVAILQGAVPAVLDQIGHAVKRAARVKDAQGLLLDLTSIPPTVHIVDALRGRLVGHRNLGGAFVDERVDVGRVEGALLVIELREVERRRGAVKGQRVVVVVVEDPLLRLEAHDGVLAQRNGAREGLRHDDGLRPTVLRIERKRARRYVAAGGCRAPSVTHGGRRSVVLLRGRIGHRVVDGHGRLVFRRLHGIPLVVDPLLVYLDDARARQ